MREGGGGSRAVWNFSENSSDFVAPPFLKERHIDERQTRVHRRPTNVNYNYNHFPGRFAKMAFANIKTQLPEDFHGGE